MQIKSSSSILPNTVEWSFYYTSVFPIFKAIWTAARQKQWDDPMCITTQFDQSSLSASRNLGSLVTHWAHSKDSDQTRWMPSWSESSLDSQVILLVWSLYSFHSVLSFLRFQHVQLFRINREEVMIMKKQRQWRGKHNAKKIKCCDRHYFWVQHYWLSRGARSVALKWAQFRAFYKWLLTKYGDLFCQRTIIVFC